MGKLITFEGLDGSGKTSVLEGVHKKLEEAGKTVLVLREPGSTKLGEEIRTLVKSDTPRAKLAETLLFSAARADLVEHIIRPSLKHYDVILMDRYIDSTTAYQAYGHQQDVQTITGINRSVVGLAMPDLTIVVTTPLATALKRISKRGAADRFETDQAFLKRVEKGYKEIIKSDPDRVKSVKNDKLPKAIDEAFELVMQSLKRRKQHKRQSLAVLAKAEEGRFKAVVGRIGRDDNDKPTLLINEIKRVNGRKVLADHAWLAYGRELAKVGTLLPGDIIEFDGKVEPYEHVGKNGKTYQEFGINDIKKVSLIKAVRVKKNKDDFAREDLTYLDAILDDKIFEERLSRYLRYVTAMIHKYF